MLGGNGSGIIQQGMTSSERLPQNLHSEVFCYLPHVSDQNLYKKETIVRNQTVYGGRPDILSLDGGNTPCTL